MYKLRTVFDRSNNDIVISYVTGVCVCVCVLCCVVLCCVVLCCVVLCCVVLCCVQSQTMQTTEHHPWQSAECIKDFTIQMVTLS